MFFSSRVCCIPRQKRSLSLHHSWTPVTVTSSGSWTLSQPVYCPSNVGKTKLPGLPSVGMAEAATWNIAAGTPASWSKGVIVCYHIVVFLLVVRGEWAHKRVAFWCLVLAAFQYCNLWLLSDEGWLCALLEDVSISMLAWSVGILYLISKTGKYYSCKSVLESGGSAK